MDGMTRAREIRVVVADDHTSFRGGLRGLLEDAGFTVVAEAPDGANAVRLVRELRPDVAILDLHMPQMDGIDATSEIVQLDPAPKVLVLTVSTTSTDVLDAIAAGASGYLLKDAAAENIVEAIHSALAGRAPIAPEVAGAVLTRVRSTAPVLADSLPPLTDREADVLRLIALGRENSEIAEELFLSQSSVKNLVSSVLEKLGVQSRVQAAVRAARAGLV